MRQLKRALIILVVLAVAGGALAYRWKGLYVVVQNSTASVLTDVSATYAGGEVSVERLPPTEIFRARIQPTGECDVVIVFTDGEGRRHEQAADVCIEPGYRGTIRAEIVSGNRFVISCDVKP